MKFLSSDNFWLHDVLYTSVIYFVFLQGVLDVLMVQGGPLKGDEDNHPPAGNLLAYRQSLSEDHTFLKVLGMHDCNDSV